jgi:hypothetical protein
MCFPANVANKPSLLVLLDKVIPSTVSVFAGRFEGERAQGVCECVCVGGGGATKYGYSTRRKSTGRRPPCCISGLWHTICPHVSLTPYAPLPQVTVLYLPRWIGLDPPPGKGGRA